MNKKILFLILLGGTLILPLGVSADVPAMVTNIETAAKTIGISIVVIGWVIAGILYLTSAGSPEKTGIAKKAMIAAVIGTALIVLSTVALITISALLCPGGTC